MTDIDSNALIQRRLNFTDKDLEANRSGELSYDQQYRIRQQQIWTAWIGWGTVCVLCVAAGLLIKQASSQIYVPIVLVLIVGALIVRSFSNQSQTRSILSKNQVSTVSGVLSRTMMQGTKGTPTDICALRVNYEIFLVHKTIGQVFDDGEHYTLYYVPQTNQILSAEFSIDQETNSV